MRAIRMIDADHIKEQAERIRNVAQSVIDACDNNTAIDALARNKLMSGSTAQDAAVLGIMLVQYEAEEK
jgi:hypothetical protein